MAHIQELPVEDIATKVTADVSAMQFNRQPIVDDYSSYGDTSLDAQWFVATERVRRAIVSSPEMRRGMTPLVSEPLSEDLPREALSAAAGSSREMASALGRLGRLNTVLGLSSVPDELIVPDVTHAPRYAGPEQVTRILTQHAKENQNFYEHSRRRLANVAQNGRGITGAEAWLVALRYRYAREAKLLGLMAEMTDEPGALHDRGDGTVGRELKSGVAIVMTQEAAEATPQILNPANWQSRRVIKDRVQAVIIDGQEYIMKERKTPKHTDTTEGGHTDGATSQQEFETARQFAGLGTVREGEIALHWEKPIGYVEFPDGFQFCLFESEKDLEKAAHIETEGVVDMLAEAIGNEPELYRDEFAHIKKAAKSMYKQGEIGIWGKRQETGRSAKLRHGVARIRAAVQRKERPLANDDLTFDEFARAKAIALRYLAHQKLQDIIIAEGYTNADHDGDSPRVIVSPGEKPTYDVTIFDLERYFKISKSEVARIQDIRQGDLNSIDHAARFGGLFKVAETYERGITHAAVFALLRDAGMQL